MIESIGTRGVLARALFVVAEATEEPGLQWLAPFAVASMAEWSRDRGAMCSSSMAT